MKNTKLTQLNLLTDEVNIKFNVLGALVLHRISREIGGRYVITEDHSSLRKRNPKLTKKMTKPTSLRNDVGNSSVLDLSTQTGDSRLPFRGPRDKRVTEEDTISVRGASSVRTTSPIRVSISSVEAEAGDKDRRLACHEHTEECT